MAKSKNKGLIISIIAAALLVSASMIFAGTQMCSTDDMKAAVIQGVADYVQNGPPKKEQKATDLVGDAPSLGDKNAPVTIVEFSDFQCPYCEKFYTETYPELKKNYIDTGKVRLVFRNMPLGFHKGAYPAALSALCVREQTGDEGFFKMHDKLFENQDVLGVDDPSAIAASLALFAQDIGLDLSKYNDCVGNNTYKDVIVSDSSTAQSIGISGTPSFVINKEILVGAQPYSNFSDLIEKELAK